MTVNRRATAVAALQERLGHAFADPALFERALTHASAAASAVHNERLEFLGDRVLGLLAAEALVALDPAWREGDLSRRHAALVSGTTCAVVARALDVGPALRLDGSASAQGARENDRILGDAMEALMAAVYLDAGLEAARAVFDRAWLDRLEGIRGVQDAEAKTALQEWAMARGLPTPAYHLVKRSGSAHAPHFTVLVEVQGQGSETGEGPALRTAEKAAARKLLNRLEGRP